MSTIPLKDALAAAYAAWRVNGCFISVKDAEFNHTTEEKQWSNKHLAALALGRLFKHSDSIYPDVTITDKDREDAEAVDKALNHFTLKRLANKLSGFEKDVYSVLGKEEILFNKQLGLVAYIPALVDKENKKKELKKFIKSFKDAPTLTPGDKIQGNLRIHDIKYINSSFTWRYLGEFKGSLVSFFRDKELELKTYHISGRVKEVQPAYEVNSVMVSTINYLRF